MKQENINKVHKVGDKFIDRMDEDCPLGEIEVIGVHIPSKKKWEAFKKSLKEPQVKNFSDKYDLSTGKRKDNSND